MSYITVEKMGRAGVIGLDRAKALNALSLDMLEDIASALDVFETDPAVELIILRSNHDRAFCAGGDVRHIRALCLEGHYDKAEHLFRIEYDLNLRISSYSKPYISLIDGVCIGGGLGISIHGKYRVASERALFAMPETAIGLFPDVGGSYFLSRMPYYSGYWMGLTGGRVNGLDTLTLGIATHFTDSKSIQPLFDDLCNLQDSVETLLDVHCTTDNDQPSTLCLEMMTEAFSQATLYDIDQSLSKMQYEEAKTAQKSLASGSPRSIQETLSLLQSGQSLSLEDCLKQEFEAAQSTIRHPDFAEGVRAVLVDKDHAPHWQSAHDFNPLWDESKQTL